MKGNLLTLLGLLVLCAVGAQYFQGQQRAQAALAEDIARSLEVFWETRGHRVELMPEGSGLRARVSVVLPENTSPQRQQWNFHLIHFVAERYPELKVTGLDVRDAARNATIPPGNISPTLGARPYAGGSTDQERAELVRREAQGWLDARVPSRALALVECTSTQVRMPSRSTLPTYHLEGPTAYVPPPRGSSYRTETQINLVVVLDDHQDSAEAMARLKEMPRLPKIVLLP